jgi:hypothetical protein
MVVGERVVALGEVGVSGLEGLALVLQLCYHCGRHSYKANVS